MATLGDFMQQELAAIRAMEMVQKSMIGNLDFAIPKISFARDLLRESDIKAAMRDALEKNRVVMNAASRLVTLASPAWAASASVASLLESMRPARDLAERLGGMHETWRGILPSLDKWSGIAFPPPALEAHLASVAWLTETSRMLTGMVSADSIGRILPFGADARAKLVSRFEGLTGAYGEFYERVSRSEEAVLQLPPAITARPAAEYFNAVDLVETTTGEDVDQDIEKEREAVRSEISFRTSDPLTAALAARFPDLVEPVEGARASLAGKGPDYVRHFTTSLRELFNQILHRLAPDDGVRKFSSAPEDFPSSKPTRAVRLRYICREINQGRFTKFVEKDVAAALAFVDLFQAGTHEVTSSFSPPQFRALLARMEGVVQFLLEITAPE